MRDVHQEFASNLMEAEKLWQSADHLTYVTYPVVKDGKLLIRVLENLYESCRKLISTVLKIEYLYKRVELKKNGEQNLRIFFEKVAERYGLNLEEMSGIREIFALGRKHKESGMEFSRVGKVVILDDDMRVSEISLEKVKSQVQLVKRVLEKVNLKFREGLERYKY
tara:strand:+ start:507 stop:1004 length:498 start_codon:yes stop_codon:yes gene_type:complete